MQNYSSTSISAALEIPSVEVQKHHLPKVAYLEYKKLN